MEQQLYYYQIVNRDTGITKNKIKHTYQRKRELERKKRQRRIKISICIAISSVIFFVAAVIYIRYLTSKINEYKNATSNMRKSTEITGSEIQVSNVNSGSCLYSYDYVVPEKLSTEEARERFLDYTDMDSRFLDIYNNYTDYPESLIKSLANNPELLSYTLKYNFAARKVTGGFTEDEINSSLPLLLQWDERWGYTNYGSDCLGITGCAPTCLSMVILGLTKNENATPDAIACYSLNNGFYSYGDGTYWSLIPNACEYYGLNAYEISMSKETIFDELQNGHPIK